VTSQLRSFVSNFPPIVPFSMFHRSKLAHGVDCHLNSTTIRHVSFIRIRMCQSKNKISFKLFHPSPDVQPNCETVETVGDRVTRIPFRLHLIPSGQGSARQNKIRRKKTLKWPVISPRFTAAQPSCEPCPLGESFSQKLNLNFSQNFREIGLSCVSRTSLRPVRIE
jgi:hypothetical protein